MAQVIVILLSVSCLVRSQTLFLLASSILVPHFSVAMLCCSGTSEKTEKQILGCIGRYNTTSLEKL